MASSFRAALVQATPVLGDVKANTAFVVDAIKREREADLLVFPELYLSGYAMRDGLRHAAVTADGDAMREIVNACRDASAHAVVGAPRPAKQRGVLHNSLFLVGPDGVIGTYDKTYLPTFSVFEEDLYFKEGNALPVFDTPLGRSARRPGERGDDPGVVRIGLTICYDFFFPEVPKTLALKGADVIVCASASPSVSRKYFEVLFPARAVETTAWILYANLAGPQDTLQFWGGCQAWGPAGDRKAMGPIDDAPAVTRVTVDLDELTAVRGKRPALRDTRAEVARRFAHAAEDA